MVNTLANNQPQIAKATLNDVRIMFRNFAGAAGKFNNEGNRNFVAFLPEDVAAAMAEDGWNIKALPSREEGEPAQAYITVKVNFAGPRPPKVNMISSRGRTALTEDTIAILDWADIEKTDLIISPYNWNVNGKSGVSAYLDTIFVTIRENELEQRYADVQNAPDSAQNTMVWQETPAEVSGQNFAELES